MVPNDLPIVVTGATGYVGGRLVPAHAVIFKRMLGAIVDRAERLSLRPLVREQVGE